MLVLLKVNLMEELIKRSVRENDLLEGTLKIKLLGIGENNINYLVSSFDKKIVYRIGLRKEFEKNLKREYDLLRYIPEGLAPKQIFFDKTKKIIPQVYSVISFLPGKHIKKWDECKLFLHAESLAKLHKKRYAKWGRERFSKKLDLLKKVKKELKDYDQDFYDADPELTELMPKFLNYVKAHNKLF